MVRFWPCIPGKTPWNKEFAWTVCRTTTTLHVHHSRRFLTMLWPCKFPLHTLWKYTFHIISSFVKSPRFFFLPIASYVCVGERKLRWSFCKSSFFNILAPLLFSGFFGKNWVPPWMLGVLRRFMKVQRWWKVTRGFPATRIPVSGWNFHKCVMCCGRKKGLFLKCCAPPPGWNIALYFAWELHKTKSMANHNVRVFLEIFHMNYRNNYRTDKNFRWKNCHLKKFRHQKISATIIFATKNFHHQKIFGNKNFRQQKFSATKIFGNKSILIAYTCS